MIRSKSAIETINAQTRPSVQANPGRGRAPRADHRWPKHKKSAFDTKMLTEYHQVASAISTAPSHCVAVMSSSEEW